MSSFGRQMQHLLVFGTLVAIVVGCGRATDMPEDSEIKTILDTREPEVDREVAEPSHRDRRLVASSLREDPAQANDPDYPTQSGTKPTSDRRKLGVNLRVGELSDRDQEITEFVLRRHAREAGDRIYFLTTTPMKEWGVHGAWVSLPDSFHERIADLPIKYRRASEAVLTDGIVYERSSGKPSWMKWVTIKRWISDTEVEVEWGVWSCPLGGGGATVTYEKVTGEWQIKGLRQSWVS